MNDGYITFSTATIEYKKSFKTRSAAEKYAIKNGLSVEVVSSKLFVCI